MTDSAPDQNTPTSDVANTIAFLKASPHFIEELSEENLGLKLEALPKPVRRLILNLSTVEWSDAVDSLQKAGVHDQQGLELIRPLVDRFRPIASKLFLAIQARRELRREYAGVGGMRAMYLFEMQLGTPILHLTFLDKDDKTLFESRETTPGMLSNVVAIMAAITRSFELCRERNLPAQSSQIEWVNENLTSLLEAVRRIAIALNIPEKDLLAGSNSPERAGVEEKVESE
jgi:hypothetical protein